MKKHLCYNITVSIEWGIAYCKKQIDFLNNWEKGEIDPYILADLDADRQRYLEKIAELEKLLE